MRPAGIPHLLRSLQMASWGKWQKSAKGRNFYQSQLFQISRPGKEWKLKYHIVLFFPNWDRLLGIAIASLIVSFCVLRNCFSNCQVGGRDGKNMLGRNVNCPPFTARREVILDNQYQRTCYVTVRIILYHRSPISQSLFLAILLVGARDAERNKTRCALQSRRLDNSCRNNFQSRI